MLRTLLLAALTHATRVGRPPAADGSRGRRGPRSPPTPYANPHRRAARVPPTPGASARRGAHPSARGYPSRSRIVGVAHGSGFELEWDGSTFACEYRFMGSAPGLRAHRGGVADPMSPSERRGVQARGEGS